jgi:ATP-dependent Clp protease ATP-binding subunit ClpA
VFDLLRPQHIVGICRKFLTALTLSGRERRQLEVVFPGEQVVNLIRERMLTGDNLLFGGRRIKSLLESLVERPLNRWIFFNNPAAGSTVEVTSRPDGEGILCNGQTIP